MDFQTTFKQSLISYYWFRLNATVDELINHDCNWNHNLISELFVPEDATLIKEIPLGLADKEDQMESYSSWFIFG